MANPEHLAKLRKEVQEWNTWRTSNPTLLPDLHGADLHGADLTFADLHGANLGEANLRRANLYAVKLTGADLGDANLGWANLYRAHLTGACLYGADLTGADFEDATLVGADFRKGHLGGAVLYETIFGNTNLKDVQGLDACRHEGPSIIDHRTLAKSGPLPLPFLRGCGLPDQYIEYLPSLFNQAMQFYSCFISYSTKDEAFAERLCADLQNNGVRCWFAPHNIQGGKKIHEQIDKAIRAYDRLLLIISEASMNSEWVKTEIANARQKERDTGKRVLFPISLVPFETIRGWTLFDADFGNDLAREIRQYFIPDFSDWKNHDNYQHAHDRLLKDLKADGQHSQT
jgi:hypothetical protein